MTKVLIAVPSRGTVNSHFMECLVKLIQNTHTYEVILEVITGSSILSSRELLARKAIHEGCSHILWLDSDMKFPPNLLHELLAHNSPVAACAYANAYSLKPNVVYEPNSDAVMWMSLGCSLMKIAVFNTLKVPYFSMDYDPLSGMHTSEWYTFCRKLKEKNIPITIDWELSKKVFHEVLINAPLSLVENSFS